MRFWGRIPLCLATIGALVLAGCTIDPRNGPDDGTGNTTDDCAGAVPQRQRQWQLSDPPTCFESGPVAEVPGFAYAAGDMVFGVATGTDFTMYDGATGKQLWRHGDDDEPTLESHAVRLVNGSGPLYVDGDEATVYASTSTRTDDREKKALTAFDGATGAVESSWPITQVNESSLVVGVTDEVILLADGLLYEGYVVGYGFVLRGIDRTSGKELWTRKSFAPVGVSGTTLVGLVHSDSGVGPGKVAAIDLATGEDLWTAPASAQALDESDQVRVSYVGGQSVVVTVTVRDSGESTTVILDAASGKVVSEHPVSVDECVGQATKIAACSTTTEPPLFFDPATGESVEPLVDTDGARVTAITDDAGYVDVDGTVEILAVGSGERLGNGRQVVPVQLGNGFALAEGVRSVEIYRGR